jgi:hypothetical protein
MKEQPPGSFRVVFLKNGDQRLRSCGYMASVRSFSLYQPSTSQDLYSYSGLRQECALVSNSLWLLK